MGLQKKKSRFRGTPLPLSSRQNQDAAGWESGLLINFRPLDKGIYNKKFAKQKLVALQKLTLLRHKMYGLLEH
jgi:hypothetical protein